MGWFLRKKRRRGPGGKAGDPAAPWWRGTWARRGLYLIPCAAAVALVALAWQASERMLTRYVGAEPVRSVSPARVRLLNAPPWVETAALDRMRLEAFGHLTVQRTARAPLEAVAATLGSDPWVRHVRRVQRTRDGGLVIDAEFRRPTAVVETPGGFVRVDGGGLQLPGYFAGADVAALGLPVIVGVTSEPPGPGGTWGGDDLRHGLQMVGTLAGQPYRHRITVIDVNERDRRGGRCIALAMPDRRVIWGLAPGAGTPIEADTPTKLRRLATVMALEVDPGAYPTFDIHGADIFERTPQAQQVRRNGTGIASMR